MEQVLATVRALPGALVLAPREGDDVPEQAWGDAFFYYAPDGQVPQHVQPYATIVTKDYPGDTASALSTPGRWRVNVHVGRTTFRELTGEEPRSLALPRDHTAADLVLPHPVYGEIGWVCVVNPAARTSDTVSRLLREAHEAARHRAERRQAGSR
ncbi:DUF6194 family protein [Streptomyces sp. NBC_00237]|uniref:DUF6194 family protein n=1 Tax=Streptomyces sp. NBC_00237 TaxID=2975687 RepID=UPI0022574682|nr:DUF6194 family protein [Streptomyces sp. NBC_00237]MCX5205210.1 DUF6194 family protein [Streptomyces sp. NBC_00237]